MTIYAIGDIQGCYQELRQLLQKIHFSADRDQIWFTGDLVNRGPDSLAVLRFVKDLEDNAITVLGNHDLHMLAVIYGLEKPRKKDTFEEIMQAKDRENLIEWLAHQPLMHVDYDNKNVLVHAGVYPGWNIPQAENLAKEMENILRSEQLVPFMQNMYGDQPNRWSETLTDWQRMRFITNCFTRMRFCTTDLQLELRAKCKPGMQDVGLLPWFELRNDSLKQYRIFFGHWSTLGPVAEENVVALDTGCLWGGKLTACTVDDSLTLTSLPCQGAMNPGQNE